MAVITDKTCYRELDQRTAERRKALGINQVELAKTPGIVQQTMARYEGGTLRVAAALLPPLTHALSLSAKSWSATRSTRWPAPKIQQQLE